MNRILGNIEESALDEYGEHSMSIYDSVGDLLDSFYISDSEIESFNKALNTLCKDYQLKGIF